MLDWGGHRPAVGAHIDGGTRMNPNASDPTRQRSPWIDRLALYTQLFFAAIFLVVGPLHGYARPAPSAHSIGT